MSTKKYMGALAGAAALTVLAVALPAFAATTPGQGPWQGHGGQMGGQMRPAVVGQVSAISGDTLTVASHGFGKPGTASTGTTTYSVDATNATVFKDNATSTVSAIAVGDSLFVQGTVSGTNVTATTIRDGVGMMGMHPGMGPQGARTGAGAEAGIQGNGEPVVAGTIASVSGSTFTVTNNGSATYSVDASNATVFKNNATSSVSSISSGDKVIVQGTISGTSVTASSVIDQAAPATTSGKPAHPGFFGQIGQFFQHLFGF